MWRLVEIVMAVEPAATMKILKPSGEIFGRIGRRSYAINLLVTVTGVGGIWFLGNNDFLPDWFMFTAAQRSDNWIINLTGSLIAFNDSIFCFS